MGSRRMMGFAALYHPCNSEIGYRGLFLHQLSEQLVHRTATMLEV